MRIFSMDILKGIGILLVVLGHSPIENNVFQYIYNFHMPLFFFVSGYLFYSNKKENLKEFTVDKVKRLLKVYLYFYIASIAIWIIYNIIQTGDFNMDLNIVFKEFILAKRNHISYNGALWFLPTLFLTEIIFFLIKKVIKFDLIIGVIAVYLCYLGVIRYQTMASVMTMPFTFDAVMWLILFYYLGYIVRKYIFKYENKILYKFICIVFGLPSFILLFSLNKYYSIVNYFDNNMLVIPKFIFFIMMQISGIAFYYGLSITIKRNRILEYIGRKSLFIFALHLPIVWPMMDIIFKRINFNQVDNLIITASIYVITSLLITLGAEKLYTNIKIVKKEQLKSLSLEVNNDNI